MMIASVRLRDLEFPGRAGELQRAGATPSLVRELGDNYERYHEFLRRALAEFGKEPVSDDFPSFDAYIRAWAAVQEIVLAEALLRNCRAYRRTGRPLDYPLDQSGPPLVDGEFQLVSAD